MNNTTIVYRGTTYVVLDRYLSKKLVLVCKESEILATEGIIKFPVNIQVIPDKDHPEYQK